MAGGTTTTTTTPVLPDFLANSFEKFQLKANRASDQIEDLGAFTGPFVADPTSQQLEALGLLENLANRNRGLGQGVIDLGQRTVRGDFLEGSPFLDRAISAATSPILEATTERFLPQAQSQAIQAGAFGDPRSDFLQAEVINDANRRIGDVGAQLSNENFARERVLQTRAPELLRSGFALEQAPLRTLGQVGDTRRGFDQEAIDAERARFNEELQSIIRPLNPLLTLFQGAGAIPFGQTVTAPGPSPLAGGLGGALGGASSLASLGSTLGFDELGPLGALAGIGGILGGVAGGL